eukprot:12410162-Alexandrium_andersonii.AAC.1
MPGSGQSTKRTSVCWPDASPGASSRRSATLTSPLAEPAARRSTNATLPGTCLLYTSDAADDM